MRAARDDFASYCAELLRGAGAVRARRMFGGHGLYLDDLFVGLVAGETLYLKADADSAPAFERAGGRRFEYARQERPVALHFWTPPTEALDSPALMAPWARLALEAAVRGRPRRKTARASETAGRKTTR